MRAHTEEFSDTDPRVLEVWRSLIAAKTPGERIEMAFELSDFAIQNVGIPPPHRSAPHPARPDDSRLRLGPGNTLSQPMSSATQALARLAEVLDRMEIRYAIGGSVASAAHGTPRTTLDVDLVVDLRPDQIDEFAAELSNEFYADPEQIRTAFRTAAPPT
jgi:hypothetical protein